MGSRLFAVGMVVLLAVGLEQGLAVRSSDLLIVVARFHNCYLVSVVLALQPQFGFL